MVVAPYFLSKGRHIQDDIPALVAAAQEQFPGISCSVAEPIGGWHGGVMRASTSATAWMLHWSGAAHYSRLLHQQHASQQER